jgi:hypothetical protein
MQLLIIQFTSGTNEKVLTLWCRPQTAKPGYRAPICQNSIDDVREKECFHKDLHC